MRVVWKILWRCAFYEESLHSIELILNNLVIGNQQSLIFDLMIGFRNIWRDIVIHVEYVNIPPIIQGTLNYMLRNICLLNLSYTNVVFARKFFGIDWLGILFLWKYYKKNLISYFNFQYKTTFIKPQILYVREINSNFIWKNFINLIQQNSESFIIRYCKRSLVFTFQKN